MARSSQDIRAKRDNLKRRRRELAGLRNTAANAGPPSSSKTFGTTPPPQRGPGKAIQQGYKPKETKATRVAGALLPFIAPDPKVLARGARDWRGTLLGAVEAGTFVLPQTQATRLRNQLTGGSYFDSLTGADVSDIEQAVEFGGLIPTGKVASSAAKITLKGATEAGRRLGRSGLEATATGIVKPVPKAAARKKTQTNDIALLKEIKAAEKILEETRLAQRELTDQTMLNANYDDETIDLIQETQRQYLDDLSKQIKDLEGSLSKEALQSRRIDQTVDKISNYAKRLDLYQDPNLKIRGEGILDSFKMSAADADALVWRMTSADPKRIREYVEKQVETGARIFDDPNEVTKQIVIKPRDVSGDYAQAAKFTRISGNKTLDRVIRNIETITDPDRKRVLIDAVNASQDTARQSLKTNAEALTNPSVRTDYRVFEVIPRKNAKLSEQEISEGWELSDEAHVLKPLSEHMDHLIPKAKIGERVGELIANKNDRAAVAYINFMNSFDNFASLNNKINSIIKKDEVLTKTEASKLIKEALKTGRLSEVEYEAFKNDIDWYLDQLDTAHKTLRQSLESAGLDYKDELQKLKGSLSSVSPTETLFTL